MSRYRWMTFALSVFLAYAVNLPMAQGEPLSVPAISPPLNYQIECRYEPTTQTIDGQVEITWKYGGTLPLSQIALHLYPNAFQPGSTFFNESSGQHRGVQGDVNKPGKMDLTQITYISGTNSRDLTATLRFIQPDDKNPHDRTLATVDLPRPLRLGEVLHMKVTFQTLLPDVFARSGVADPFVMAGQWYPKLAAYERQWQRGREQEGFNLHQFHANSEFYADFANYDVKITLPKAYVVGATGCEVDPPVVEGEHKRLHFVQSWVHDFAWAADPRFVTQTCTIEPKDTAPVEIRLFSQPEHLPLAERQLKAVAGALEQLCTSNGPYPYRTLTVIDPPADAPGAGGMEYPTLITGGTPNFPGERSSDPERVLVHETAHQYWYGLVATNEFEEPWLDEGLTTYSEGKILAELYPDTRIPFKFLGFPLFSTPLQDDAPGDYRTVLGSTVLDPINLPAWEFASERSYAASVYYRTALSLYTLERTVGEEKMQDILSTYFKRWAFRHPGTRDFLQVIQEKAGEPTMNHFREWISRPASMDYAVGDVRPVETPTGPAWQIRLECRGELTAPVEVIATDSNGQSHEFHCEGTERYTELTVPGDSPVMTVQVDPHERHLLDTNRLNNLWTREKSIWPALRWTLFVAAAYQALLSAGI
ncbi:M1 family metallopeptidase [Heliobacterium chlorum]|uniref:M1 family metallopeptidase n=1 Tax=Heliobacterium chlorum TaxID=2698 RepID=A0ABR7SYZ8_HELCL|nr:M1 family metallopeptidase [Heliobacterium chlorum]MBC9782963.1 M1 family metallopeptidase [Heliobacterium chlorum]